MKIQLLPEAAAEIEEAVAWYHQRNPHAAARLITRLEEARHIVTLHPQAAPVLRGTIRRYVLRGYPYDLIYRPDPDLLVILAFAHHGRRPGYWQQREH